MKIKLNNEKIVSLLNCLTRLDNPETTTDEKGTKKVMPYNLAEKVRYANIRNIKRLKAATSSFMDERESLIAAYGARQSGVGIVLEDESKRPEFELKWHELLSAEHEVELFQSNLSDWNIPNNQHLPTSIVAELLDTVIVD